MKTSLVVVGLGVILLLLFVGSKVAGDNVDVWGAVRSAPNQFLDFIAKSVSHEALWTIVIVLGVVGVIAFIQKSPPAST